MTRQDSPVSGTTTYVYNEDGELKQETDARGVTVTRAYDALNRVTTVSYPDPTLDVTYTYDAPGAFANGRLTGIGRHGETIVYEYDRFGRMTRDGALTYGYDGNGNKTTIGYPSDVTATYTYDHAGRQETLSMTVGTDPAVALVTDASYKPFGPLSSLSLGNGLIETRDYDARYQPSTIRVDGASPLLHWTYAVDPVGNITGVTDQLVPANNRIYGYQDVFYYLTQGDGPWGPRAWTYDRIGNRLTEARGPETDVYSYLANPAGGHNPKLMSVMPSGGGERFYGYDESGNTVQIVEGDSQQDLIHDGAGRMSILRSLPEEKIVSFDYDGRSYLRNASEDESECFAWQTHSFYDSEGLLYGRRHRDRIDSSLIESDWVLYFEEWPIASLKVLSTGSTLTYLSADHLGTPTLTTTDSGDPAWQGGFEPFGGDWSQAEAQSMFLRFPGQWSDEAWTSGPNRLSYNVYRWYDSRSGRYTRPDPVSSLRALDAYSYAKQRPLNLSDRLGLQAQRAMRTGRAEDDACCGEALRSNLFAQAGAGGIVVCCNGRKVPCAIEYTGFTTSGVLAQKIWVQCAMAHERQHVADLPDCPQKCGGPVELARFPTNWERNYSECRGTDIEIDCLVKSQGACGGDPICIAALDARKKQAADLKRDSGCL